MCAEVLLRHRAHREGKHSERISNHCGQGESKNKTILFVGLVLLSKLSLGQSKQAGKPDYATNDTGNWNAPVRTQPGGANTFPLKIVRTTADGIWTLTQNFSRNPGERYAKITMTLKNNTAISRTASLVRYADVDAPFGATEFTNTFDFTFSAGLGFVRGNFGLAIQNGTPPAAHTAFVQNVSSGPDPCNPFANLPAATFTGDGSVGIVFPFTIPKTSAKTVAVIYRPF